MFIEFGKPERRLCRSNQELLDYIAKYNGRANCYSTVYAYEELDREEHYRLKPDYSTAIINRVFMDFDGPNAFEDMLKVHNRLYEDNILHHVNFSGRGYHLFVHTKIENLKYPKLALARYAVGLTNNQDMQVVGDVARLVRIPNTWHLGAERYCVNLQLDTILRVIKEGNDNIVKELARTPNFAFTTFGSKKISLKEFDFEEECEEFQYEDVEILVNDIPGCVQYAMQNPRPSYTQRLLYFSYLRELGYSMESALAMVRDVWDYQKMKHCVRVERQPHSVWRNRVLFPSCRTNKDNGDCRRCRIK